MNSARQRGRRGIVFLAALPMLLSAALPWVLQRPNRLAPGTYLTLEPGWRALLVLLALALFLTTQRWPALLGWVASLSVAGGFWLLGELARTALVGAAEFARASAASGFWLFLLGAGIAAYAATHFNTDNTGWARLAAWLWLPALLALVLTGHLSSWSVLIEGQREGPRWVQELVQHVKLTASALLLALLIGAPLAVWSAGRERAAQGVLNVANAIQTIPSLALLGLLIAPLSALANAVPALREVGVSGIGTAPALCAMTLYALLPVLRNGIVGLRGVSAGTLDAATGMGMTPAQRFWRVQLPLALPVWLTGVRQAAVMLVGVAAVAALIGAGGLGTYIFKGLQSAATDLILLGAIPATLLAVLLDAVLRGLEVFLTRRTGVTASGGAHD